jgi:hypothetical protein
VHGGPTKDCGARRASDGYIQYIMSKNLEQQILVGKINRASTIYLEFNRSSLFEYITLTRFMRLPGICAFLYVLLTAL